MDKLDQRVWEIFPDRIVNPARAKLQLPYRPVKPDALSREIDHLMTLEIKPRPSALYIHLPFCRQNCSFCGYYKTHDLDQDIVKKYIDRLILEVNWLKGFALLKRMTFEAVFFGGGTPSQVPPDLLENLVRALQASFNFSDDCEWTVELPLSDVNEERVKHLRRMGVNRVSLGVQTFETTVRRNLGRISGKEEMIDKIKMIADNGYQNICIDLIYGLPEQGLDLWRNDLELVNELPVTGTSVYPLIPFPNSGLVQNGGYPTLSNKQTYEFFKMADDYLLGNDNWQVHSPVQYGDRFRGQAQYISLTHMNADLIGLGPSSMGYIQNYQYQLKYDLHTCLNSDLHMLEKGSWFMAHRDLIPFLDLYQLSEGTGISNTKLNQLGLKIEDLIPSNLAHSVIQTSKDGFMMNQSGRFWAGNLSELITRRIIETIDL